MITVANRSNANCESFAIESMRPRCTGAGDSIATRDAVLLRIRGTLYFVAPVPELNM